MKLSFQRNDLSAAVTFEDNVELLPQHETPWGKEIEHELRQRSPGNAEILGEVLGNPDSIGLYRFYWNDPIEHPGNPQAWTREREGVWVPMNPIEIFRDSFGVSESLHYGKMTRVAYLCTNKGKGSGSQVIPLDEIHALTISMERMLLPFVKFDSYVKKVGNRDAETRAVAADVFLEAGGNPYFMRKLVNADDGVMDVPCIVKMRTRTGRGSKSSYFRLQDVEEIIKTLRTVA
jgi:hypothetical protein